MRTWTRKLGMVVTLSAGLALGGCSEDDPVSSASGGSGGTTMTSGGSSGTGGSSGSGGSAAAGSAGSGGTAGSAGSGAGGSAAAEAGVGDSAAPGNIVAVASANPDFSSLVAAVQKAELVDALSGAGPFTVFAPTNAAFNALLTALGTTLEAIPKAQLTDVLKYHVLAARVPAADVVTKTSATTLLGSDVRISVDGMKVLLNGSTQVVATDVAASNGVIHVIDKVLVPAGDIPTVATGNPDFSSLVAALQKADLVTTLQGTGPFTVFAPTNAAFSAFLASAGLTLETVPVATLKPILLYHVVPSKLYSEDVVKATKATTAQGSDVTIAVAAGKVTLNGSTNVTAVDVLARNGVVHVIDKVLVPPM